MKTTDDSQGCTSPDKKTETFFPTRFEFQIWGPFRVSHFVKHLGASRLEYKIRKFDHTALRRDRSQFVQEQITTIHPDGNRWNLFWQDVEQIGVWRWKRYYMNLHICDGTMWDVCLEFRKQFVETEGANAYPGGNHVSFSSNGEFEAFLQALNKLTGLKIG